MILIELWHLDHDLDMVMGLRFDFGSWLGLLFLLIEPRLYVVSGFGIGWVQNLAKVRISQS